MARARSSGGHEGTQFNHITDANKRVCERCGGTEFCILAAHADPNSSLDTTAASTFADYAITCTGGNINGTVYGCMQCGQEQADFWVIDVGASTGAAITMTNLDASVANGLAGCYVIVDDGTDAGKYYIIASNTAAAPTVITVTVATNNDEDGTMVITNKLPTNTWRWI
jgi:hypothetical protein